MHISISIKYHHILHFFILREEDTVIVLRTKFQQR